MPPEYNRIVFSYSDYYKKINELYDFDSIYFQKKSSLTILYPGDIKTRTFTDENWYYFARKSNYHI